MRWASIAMGLLVLSGCGARTSLGESDAAGGGGASAGSDAITAVSGGPGATVGPGATSTGAGGAPFACSPGDAPVELAAIAWPIAAAQDDDSLYVTSYTEDGALYRVPKAGGEAVRLADIGFGSGVAVLGDFVYVASGRNREVVRVAKDRGEVERLAGFFGPTDLAVDGDAIFVANYLENEVARLPLEGGEPVVLAAGESGVYKLAVGGGWVVWGSFASELRGVPRDGGVAQSLAPHGARRIVARSPSFYFTSNDPAPARIVRAGIDATFEVLAEDPEAAFLEGIDVDASHAYFARWRPSGRSSLARVPLGGGPVEDVFSVDEPLEVLLDGACAYVTSGTSEEEPGAVHRVSIAPRF